MVLSSAIWYLRNGHMVGIQSKKSYPNTLYRFYFLNEYRDQLLFFDTTLDHLKRELTQEGGEYSLIKKLIKENRAFVTKTFPSKEDQWVTPIQYSSPNEFRKIQRRIGSDDAQRQRKYIAGVLNHDHLYLNEILSLVSRCKTSMEITRSIINDPRKDLQQDENLLISYMRTKHYQDISTYKVMQGNNRKPRKEPYSITLRDIIFSWRVEPSSTSY